MEKSKGRECKDTIVVPPKVRLFLAEKSLDSCGKCLQPNAITGAPDLN